MILDGALAAWRTSPLAAKRAKGARPTAAFKGYRGACPLSGAFWALAAVRQSLALQRGKQK